jgi:predicted GIY-YIG superfamily endonuclease
MAKLVNYFVYILLCANGSYYVGHSRNIEQRVTRHTLGTGSQHTAIYCPKRILYHEQFDTEVEAMRRERQIKKWSRAKKKALIEGNLQCLHELAKRRR